MNYDEKIQNLQRQIELASRDVIIQDRVLGQARERVAEIQGRINMLVELKAEKMPKETPYPHQTGLAKHKKGVKKPKNDFSKEPPKKKPKPKTEKKPKTAGGPKKFTPAVIRYIRAQAGNLSNEELAQALKRNFGLDTTASSVAYTKSANKIGSKVKKPKKNPLDDDPDYPLAED